MITPRFAVPIRDGALEGISSVRDVPLLKVEDRRAKLPVAKDVLDPMAEVSASEMASHHIVGQLRQCREQVPNGSSTLPRRPAALCEHELSFETYRNIGVLQAVTNVCRQARSDAESLR